MYIKIRVIVGARTEKVVRESDDHFVISVKEKAKAKISQAVKEVLDERDSKGKT